MKFIVVIFLLLWFQDGNSIRRAWTKGFYWMIGVIKRFAFSFVVRLGFNKNSRDFWPRNRVSKKKIVEAFPYDKQQQQKTTTNRCECATVLICWWWWKQRNVLFARKPYCLFLSFVTWCFDIVHLYIFFLSVVSHSRPIKFWVMISFSHSMWQFCIDAVL